MNAKVLDLLHVRHEIYNFGAEISESANSMNRNYTQRQKEISYQRFPKSLSCPVFFNNLTTD